MRRSRWRKGNPNFNAGELVLLKDDDYTKRGRWPLARITRVLPGRDGVVRVVELKTKDGVYTRPVANLFKLEDNLLNDVRQGGQFVRTVKNEFKIAAYNLFQCRNPCLQFIPMSKSLPTIYSYDGPPNTFQYVLNEPLIARTY